MLARARSAVDIRGPDFPGQAPRERTVVGVVVSWVRVVVVRSVLEEVRMVVPGIVVIFPADAPVVGSYGAGE